MVLLHNGILHSHENIVQCKSVPESYKMKEPDVQLYLQYFSIYIELKNHIRCQNNISSLFII